MLKYYLLTVKYLFTNIKKKCIRKQIFCSLGLESCIWPGRCQIIEKNSVTLYLDGAHTKQSLKHCAKWFAEASEKEKSKLK